jgi:hypothetical protein
MGVIDLRINRLRLVGILLILLGGVLLKTNFMSKAVTTVLWPVLEGSSEGKAVILLVMMGSLLLLSSFSTSNEWLSHRFFSEKWADGKRYLLISILTIFSTCVVGLLTEVWIRLKFGVSIFTIFISMNPRPSTTSIMHSHVFKSLIGYMVSLFGKIAPHNINTGVSLIQYTSPFAFLIVITLPLVYIAGLLAMKDMRDTYKILTSFAITVAIIGMIDGGMFSQPLLIGIGILLCVYFAKNPFSLRNLIKPAAIIGIIIFTWFAIELGGTNTAYHQLTVINQSEPVNMTSYDVMGVQQHGNETVYIIKPSVSDKTTVESLFKDFNGKAGCMFMTWNFYSYI